MPKAIAVCLISITSCLFLSCRENASSNNNALFQLVPSSRTGITFNNRVKDTRELNIFNFRNFYNGAGVAIGDINNDGWSDIFFTSNQDENKLYVNRGNWTFEDLTDASGLKSEGKWYTGVTMADVNGDGWLDIYVCNSGGLVGYNKPNDLYINQGNGTFLEQAEVYGLNDIGLSTHAAFFDYDHDGDLDCFVLNNSPRSIESFGYKSIRHIRDSINGDRLYRNEKGKFHDVSAEAGIYGSEIGFGLGVTVGDVNNDGWEDMYVSNDFFERDYLYINQQNGKFTEVINEAIGHISQGSMGSDMIDINNDGWLDIFTTEMLPEHDRKLKTTIKFDEYDVQNARLHNDFHHQFTTNCLQLNNGDGTFSEIAQLAGVDATGWSWGALSFDFDNDGLKDLFVCNGISKDLTDQDFLEFFGSAEVLNKVKEGGFDFQDILDKMPSNMIPNYAFLNQGNLRFKNVADSIGMGTPSFSNGAAYGDLDNDGGIDLVVNNENLEAFVYKNTASERLKHHYLKIKLNGKAPNVQGIGARVTIYTKEGLQVLEQMPSRGFQSSVDPVLHFGLGKNEVADSIVVRWPDMRSQVLKNVRVDTTVTIRQSDATGVMQPSATQTPKGLFVENVTAKVTTGNIVHRENMFIDFDVERLIPRMLSTEGPALAVADINNDGTEDFYMGSAVGDTAKIFVQDKQGRFTQVGQDAFIKDKYFENTASAFFDADADGDMDLVVGSGGNQAKAGSPYLFVRLYLNNGKGIFTRQAAGWPQVSVNASCITLLDFDSDGRLDLFVGARSIPGMYGVPPSSVLIRNAGKGNFVDVTNSQGASLLDLGMVTDAKFVDLDSDGRGELVVAGDWMPVTIFRIQGGKLQKSEEIKGAKGWWNCLETDDIDNDGDVDLVGGNTGLNSRIRATTDKPAKLYVGDFDKNGQVECIPVYFKTDGKAYPYFMKGELQAQIPSLRKDFLYYTDYAGKPIEQIFSKEQLKDIRMLEVNNAQTTLFRNDGKGRFSMEPLPLQAQLSYVFGAYIDDVNRDGVKDMLLAGNFYGLKPQGGRFDASYGTTLIGTSERRYNYYAPAESGFMVSGEARKLRRLKKAGGGTYIIAAMNNDSLKIFERK